MACKIEDLDHNPWTQKPHVGWSKAYFIANHNHKKTYKLSPVSCSISIWGQKGMTHHFRCVLTEPMFEQVHVSVHRCTSV